MWYYSLPSCAACYAVCVLAVAFIDDVECEEVTRLRIELLTKKEQYEGACNLLGWCMYSERHIDDTEMTIQYFTLLHRLRRFGEFIDRVGCVYF